MILFIYCDANHKAPSDREIGLESERKKREIKEESVKMCKFLSFL